MAHRILRAGGYDPTGRGVRGSAPAGNPKLRGKLLRIAVALQDEGHRLGGGLIEPCHDYPGLWEMRTIFNGWLGREFFGFDDLRVVLLHGYVKRAGEAASTPDFATAHAYWLAYVATRRVSPPEQGTGGAR